LIDNEDATSRDAFHRWLLPVALLAIVYLALISLQVRQRLWFDELFTYYVAQAPNLPRFFDELAHVDLNPPLLYLLVRFCQSIFGVSEVATRIPSVVGFFAASILAFFLLRRRIGSVWAGLAVLMFWCTPFFRYATEARPYGILLGFFTLLLYSYDKLYSSDRTAETSGTLRWRAGILGGSLGMMLSHTLAPFSILPFCVTEAVRSVQVRRIDWGTWAALVLPLLPTPGAELPDCPVSTPVIGVLPVDFDVIF